MLYSMNSEDRQEDIRHVSIDDFIETIFVKGEETRSPEYHDRLKDIFTYVRDRHEAQTIGDVSAVLQRREIHPEAVRFWIEEDYIRAIDSLDYGLVFQGVERGYPELSDTLHELEKERILAQANEGRQLYENHEHIQQQSERLEEAYNYYISTTRQDISSIDLAEYAAVITSHLKEFLELLDVGEQQLRNAAGIYKYLADNGCQTLYEATQELLMGGFDKDIVSLWVETGILKDTKPFDHYLLYMAVKRGYDDLVE
ncbi:MAG: hypothetical protein ACOC32_02975 [Nanoarchaeota archaeon]